MNSAGWSRASAAASRARKAMPRSPLADHDTPLGRADEAMARILLVLLRLPDPVRGRGEAGAQADIGTRGQDAPRAERQGQIERRGFRATLRPRMRGDSVPASSRPTSAETSQNGTKFRVSEPPSRLGRVAVATSPVFDTGLVIVL